MPGAGPVESTRISSGYSRSSEKSTDENNKNPFNYWQENTLSALDSISKKALEELDGILANDKELAKSLGLVSSQNIGDEKSVVERIILLFNLLQPSTSIVLVGVPEIPQDLLFDPWMATTKIKFSSRVSNCLRNDSIDYLGQLVSLTEKQMVRIPNFGKKTLGEVKVVLESLYGAHLGMKHPEIDAVLHKHPLPEWLLT